MKLLAAHINWISYLIPFGAAFLIAVILTPLAKWIAKKVKAIDYPSKIKIHKNPMPRLGGLAIFFAFILLVIFDLIWGHRIVGRVLEMRHVLGLLIGAGVIVITGVIDDIKKLKPTQKLFGQIIAALVVIFSGIGIDFIASPFGSHFALDVIKIPITFSESTFQLVVFADLFALFWILGMVNTANFLDGLDGLISGVGFIAAMFLFFLSLRPQVNQPEVAYLSIIFAGALLGFLIFNFNPAKIFAGDSGSMLIGFVIGVLSIINGAKIATALLVMGFPILDVAWSILRRLIKKQSPFQGDKRHFHHRLLELGLSQKQAVLLIYAIAICFGLAAFLLQGSKEKLAALLILGFLMLAMTFVIVKLIRMKQLQLRGRRAR